MSSGDWDIAVDDSAADVYFFADALLYFSIFRSLSVLLALFCSSFVFGTSLSRSALPC